jgi:hypothetical protein
VAWPLVPGGAMVRVGNKHTDIDEFLMPAIGPPTFGARPLAPDLWPPTFDALAAWPRGR